MKKVIIGSLMTIIVLLGCKKKEKDPVEFFSFTADGVDYFYPQIKGTSFVGDWSTLGAGVAAGNLGYIIGAHSEVKPSARGRFLFYLNENLMLTEDTIILYGNNGWVEIRDFLFKGNSYSSNDTYNGRIIFHQKNKEFLKGEFEFKAQQQYNGSIIHITNGKFSIIPSH